MRDTNRYITLEVARLWALVGFNDDFSKKKYIHLNDDLKIMFAHLRIMFAHLGYSVHTFKLKDFHMNEKKTRITRKVIKDTSIKIRLTSKKKEEIKKFCKENEITMTVFLDNAIEVMLGNYE